VSESEFGKLLRMYRQRKEMNQKQLAKRAGINNSFVSHLESEDGTARPSQKVVRDLADALNLTKDETRIFLAAADFIDTPDDADRARIEKVLPEKLRALPSLINELTELETRHLEDIIEFYSQQVQKRSSRK